MLRLHEVRGLNLLGIIDCSVSEPVRQTRVEKIDDIDRIIDFIQIRLDIRMYNRILLVNLTSYKKL